VATRVTLRCVAKVPATLPNFRGSSANFDSLSSPFAVMQKHMESRNFMVLSVGVRFSLFYCSKDGGGLWDFEVSGIKHRPNKCGHNSNFRASDEMTEGSAGCIFSDCENFGFHDVEYEILSDRSVSAPLVAPQFPMDGLRLGDTFDFKRSLPTLSFSSAPDSLSPLESHLLDKFQMIYQSKPDVVAFAPGCLEFLGNHLNYNGGSVLGAAINLGVSACVALQMGSLQEPCITLATSQSARPVSDGVNPPPKVSVLFDDLQKQFDKQSRTIPEWAVYAVCVDISVYDKRIHFKSFSTRINLYVTSGRSVFSMSCDLKA
jgi:hypothetical protein